MRVAEVAGRLPPSGGLAVALWGGCIAALLGTMGIVTGAAADESNASLTEKRGLFPIVTVLRILNHQVLLLN